MTTRRRRQVLTIALLAALSAGCRGGGELPGGAGGGDPAARAVDHEAGGGQVGGGEAAGAAAGEPAPTDGSAELREPAPFVRALGTVQDGGLPHAACSCLRCDTARRDPAARRLVASLALVLPSSGEVYLFDATPDLREQLDRLADVRPGAAAGRVDRAPVSGVFLTHAHVGHYLGLAFFGYEAVHAPGLPVWASRRMAGFLRANGPWSQLVELGNVELRELEPGRPVELAGGVRVVPFAAPHRDEYADTLGFRIEGPRRSLIYLPDTDSWAAWETAAGGLHPAELIGGVDVALLDGTFYSPDELPGRSVGAIGHPLIPRTMELLAGLDATRVLFTHLNHSNPALEPGSTARRAIEAAGFAVLAEGEEFAL